MDLGISGKCALVLGAGGGLGGAIAQTLAAEGAKVAVADIDVAAAEKTVTDIASAGGEAFAIKWDIGDLTVLEGNVAQIEARYGNIAILVNNTGGPPPTPVAPASPPTSSCPDVSRASPFSMSRRPSAKAAWLRKSPRKAPPPSPSAATENRKNTATWSRFSPANAPLSLREA